MSEERSAEVQRQPEAQHPGDTAPHIRVTGKVQVELRIKSEQRQYQCRPPGMLWRGPDRIDDPANRIGGKLLEESDGEQVQPGDTEIAPAEPFGESELWRERAATHDRTGDQMR